MARCGECGFDWELDAPTTVAGLERLSAAFTERVDRAAVAAMLRRRPAEGVWSPLEYTVHVRDVADFYRERIGRVLAEDRPEMWSVSFDQLALERRYNAEDPSTCLAALREHLRVVIDRLTDLEAAQWHRVGIGSLGDERTTLDLARRLLHDGEHHLQDIDRGLEAMS